MGKSLIIKGANFYNNRIPSTISAPVISLTISSGVISVTITQAQNLNIYYTIDGSIPSQSSTRYTAPFNVSFGTTIKAIAYTASGQHSEVTTKQAMSILNVSDYYANAAALGSANPDVAGNVIVASGFHSIYLILGNNIPDTASEVWIDASQWKPNNAVSYNTNVRSDFSHLTYTSDLEPIPLEDGYYKYKFKTITPNDISVMINIQDSQNPNLPSPLYVYYI